MDGSILKHRFILCYTWVCIFYLWRHSSNRA